MSDYKTIVIRLSGDSGDGVQLIGEQLTITAALKGHDVRSLPDFPAEIRAPVGTIAGVSEFQLAMSEQVVFTAGEEVDILVALNPAALKKSLSYLRHGGLLIINEDNFQAKDWQKACLDSELLIQINAHYQIISFPLISYTLKALESLKISHNQAKRAKNFYILGVVLWLFDLSAEYCIQNIHKKFKNNDEIKVINQQALLAGYNYAMTLELSRQHFTLQSVMRLPGYYRQLNGTEAVGLALATLAVQTKRSVFVSGYPITPASAILHECAKLQDYGVSLLQAEDEIAAIGACLGASYGGFLALSCTSGPGLDLKSETLGLAVMTELPLVVVDVQRAGASTGLPTKTSQSDYNQALYGRHGEAPLIVIAAQSPSDCFNTIIEAFDLAVKLMTPVIVLMDAYLANASELWKIPNFENLPSINWQFNRFNKPYQRDAHLSRSWNLPGTKDFIYQTGGLEKQGEDGRISYDADNHQAMVELRSKKIANAVNYYLPIKIEGDSNANLVLVGWGSTYGSLKAAVEECLKQDISVALIHLRNLYPLPKQLKSLLVNKTVLVAELNSGQLALQLKGQYAIKVQSISQINGLPFTTPFLVKAIKAELAYDY